MADWTRMRASEEWTRVLHARFVDAADPKTINAFLDGLDARRSTLPVARLETDFRARTLEVLMEIPTQSDVDVWRDVITESHLAEVVESA